MLKVEVLGPILRAIPGHVSPLCGAAEEVIHLPRAIATAVGHCACQVINSIPERSRLDRRCRYSVNSHLEYR